eukprot:jgi/Ulvmu1/6505/UM003_0138.1
MLPLRAGCIYLPNVALFSRTQPRLVLKCLHPAHTDFLQYIQSFVLIARVYSLTRFALRSSMGNSGKHNRQDHRLNDMSQASMNAPESPFSQQSMGSIYDNYEASEAAQKSRLAAQNSALYHSASLPCPLRSFVSIGRAPSSRPAAAPPAADSSTVSGIIPTFSPVFSSFGHSTSFDSVRSQPIAIPPVDAYASAPLSASTGPLSRTTDSGMSAAYADTSSHAPTAPISRASFADEDMEVSFRDWHNGVFSPSW